MDENNNRPHHTPETESESVEEKPAVEIRTSASSNHQTSAEINLMRTQLCEFTDDFNRETVPLLDALTALEISIDTLPSAHAVRTMQPALRELYHHIDVLQNKVQEQRAYVLIFGPLKSGKSTFMNATCAAYVSEVTALPAYPCLVHLHHGQKPSFVVTHYDGTTQPFADKKALKDAVEQAHGKLTKRLREVESTGEKFEPATHMPSALRRIDVTLPVPDLASSGAVLVDTPGLYSRMKFGYDRMTRDFRNTAACAIFVVRSDNLFFEQVFEEFTELLDLFSRIFLVVNLDRRKQDLAENGELVPSLEQTDPERIIEAFRNLSMSTPLKKASDEGRLSIYPVDLLNTASRRIKQGGEPTEPSKTEVDPHFEALRGDLAHYLNSSDYLKDFLTDTLRRGLALIGELTGTLRKKPFVDLSDELKGLQREQTAAKTELRAIEHLQRVEWKPAVRTLEEKLVSETESVLEETRRSIHTAIGEQVDQWWQSEGSLSHLADEALNRQMTHYAKRFVDHFTGFLEARLAEKPGGLDIAGRLEEDLQILEIDLSQRAVKALHQVRPQSEEYGSAAELATEAIPVKRCFWDWLLFRSGRRTRRRVFGPPDNPSKALSVAVKDRRLGEAGREAILTQAREEVMSLWDDTMRDLPGRTLDAYMKVLTDHLRTDLEERSKQSRKQLERQTGTLATASKVGACADALNQVAAGSMKSLEQIKKKYI